MHIEVILIEATPNSTLSKLLLDGDFFGFVIEDGPRTVKVPGVTRIPAGTYPVKQRFHGGFYEKYRRMFGHQFALQIMDVPEFTSILFHCGNTVADTRGCLLLNKWVGFNSTQQVFEGRESTVLYKAFFLRLAAAFAAKEPVTVTIQRDLPNAA